MIDYACECSMFEKERECECVCETERQRDRESSGQRVWLQLMPQRLKMDELKTLKSFRN